MNEGKSQVFKMASFSGFSGSTLRRAAAALRTFVMASNRTETFLHLLTTLFVSSTPYGSVPNVLDMVQVLILTSL